MIMVMEVTTENGEVTLPYLLHCGQCDVEVTHGRLWEAFCGLTLFEECQATAGFLARIPHLVGKQDFIMDII